MNRLKEKYEKTIVSDLMSKHNYKNVRNIKSYEVSLKITKEKEGV